MVGPREHHRHPVGQNHIIPHPWRAGCWMTIDTAGWDEDLVPSEATWCCMVVRVLLSTIPTVWQPCWDEVLLASAINNKMQWGPLQPQLWMKQALPLFRICWFFRTPLWNFAPNKFPTNVCNRRIESSAPSFFFSSAMEGFWASESDCPLERQSRDPTCYTRTSSGTCTGKRSKGACSDTIDPNCFWEQNEAEILQWNTHKYCQK